MAREQHLRVVFARCAVVGRACQHGGEQEFGVVKDFARHADPCEQAHAFDVIAVIQQEAPDEGFGGIQIAVREESRCGHDLGRKSCERRHLPGGSGGGMRIAGHPVESFEHAPTRGQRGVEFHGSHERRNRLRRPLQRDKAVSALLMEAAEARVAPLEAIEDRERLGDATPIALGEREQQQYVAVVRRQVEHVLLVIDRVGTFLSTALDVDVTG